MKLDNLIKEYLIENWKKISRKVIETKNQTIIANLEKKCKTGTIYESEEWIVEEGTNGFLSISYFYNSHYYSEIILQIKDNKVHYVRSDN